MARFTYNSNTPFGQMISEAVDNIQTGTDKLIRTYSVISMMSAEECETELGVPKDQFTNFRNRLNDLQVHLQEEKFQEKLTMLDQG